MSGWLSWRFNSSGLPINGRTKPVRVDATRYHVTLSYHIIVIICILHIRHTKLAITVYIIRQFTGKFAENKTY